LVTCNKFLFQKITVEADFVIAIDGVAHKRKDPQSYALANVWIFKLKLIALLLKPLLCMSKCSVCLTVRIVTRKNSIHSLVDMIRTFLDKRPGGIVLQFCPPPNEVPFSANEIPFLDGHQLLGASGCSGK
jgi:hypothetical protein